jgi:hypothetical protein
MAKMVRMSFTVPPSLRDDFDYVSLRLGVSKSSVLSSMMSGALSEIVLILRDIPPVPAESDVLRFRDSSVRLINSRLSDLKVVMDESGVGHAGIR